MPTFSHHTSVLSLNNKNNSGGYVFISPPIMYIHQVEAWNRKCALQEQVNHRYCVEWEHDYHHRSVGCCCSLACQELIISRARLKELQNHIRISEVAFKRDSDDVDELLATFRSYKEAESDAVVQLEKEEQEMNRLLLEVA